MGTSKTWMAAISKLQGGRWVGIVAEMWPSSPRDYFKTLYIPSWLPQRMVRQFPQKVKGLWQLWKKKKKQLNTQLAVSLPGTFHFLSGKGSLDVQSRHIGRPFAVVTDMVTAERYSSSLRSCRVEWHRAQRFGMNSWQNLKTKAGLQSALDKIGKAYGMMPFTQLPFVDPHVLSVSPPLAGVYCKGCSHSQRTLWHCDKENSDPHQFKVELLNLH